MNKLRKNNLFVFVRGPGAPWERYKQIITPSGAGAQWPESLTFLAAAPERSRRGGDGGLLLLLLLVGAEQIGPFCLNFHLLSARFDRNGGEQGSRKRATSNCAPLADC